MVFYNSFRLISVFLDALIVDKHPTDVINEGGGKNLPLGTMGDWLYKYRMELHTTGKLENTGALLVDLIADRDP